MSREIQPGAEGERLRRLRAQYGFEAFKIRVGRANGHDRDQWEGRTEKLVPAVRRAVGDEVHLLADANSCYTPPRAIEVGRLLEAHGFSHYEEPCPYWELEWTAEVTKALKVPVAGGEQDNDMAQWRRMVRMSAVDIVQPDVCYVGGLTRALRVAQMARQAGLLCVPHSANHSLVTLFSLHLLAAIPNAGPFLEYSIEFEADLNHEAARMFSPVLKVENGRAAISGEPGWGVRIHEDWLQEAARQESHV
jgi:L-alanine-DL-glutamate epimerase-like enolase superfamily enzyme